MYTSYTYVTFKEYKPKNRKNYYSASLVKAPYIKT